MNQNTLQITGDSALFALNDDINITGTLHIQFIPRTDNTLTIIDNPNNPVPHSITFSGHKGGDGHIVQHSHGDLIFEGTDLFRGTIYTDDGYGRFVLNGNSAANIIMNGGEIAGTGRTRGHLYATNGAIISPGYNGNFGTLSFGSAYLDPSTILNFTLGSAANSIRVNGDLTLGGNLNVNAGPGFGNGAYQLFTHGGALAYNPDDFNLSHIPDGYDPSQFRLQTNILGEINLLVGSGMHFWKGNPDGTNWGGHGVWDNVTPNFTDADGTHPETWNKYIAVFAGNPGTVDVQDNVVFRKIQFLANGYTIHSSNDSRLLASGPADIDVASTHQADISAEITGPGSISKNGPGTLILSHDNSYTGGTILNEGTLVANTPYALSSGLVTLQAGVLRLGTNTLHVGSYTQNRDATLALRANDQLVVDGNANLGGTLSLEGKPSGFRKGMPLITSQGLNGSRFDNVQQSQTSIKKLSTDYDSNNVYVDTHFDAIYPYAKSRNARALAYRLDAFSNSGRNEDLFDSLADFTLEQVPAALEKLVPNQVFVLSSIGLLVSRSQMLNLQGRLDDLSGYTNDEQLSANASNQDGLFSARVSLVSPQITQERWSFYMHGSGSFSRQNQDRENEIVGYDYGQGGTFIGADYRLSDKVYVGGAASYTYTDASFQGDRGSLSADSYSGHLYTAYAQPKGLNLISSVGFEDHEFDLKRRALTDTAHSKPQSKGVDFQSQVSYNIPLESNFMVSPYTGVAYSAFWMRGFQEHNSKANLKFSDNQTNSLRSTARVKAKYVKRFTKSIRKASVGANVGWDHEYCDAQSRGMNAEWIGSRVPSFQVQGGRIGPDTFISGVNLRLAITKPLSIVTGYNLAANPDYVWHGFSVGANLAF